MTSLKFNVINIISMVTTIKIASLVFNVITAKYLVIINMSASLKTQII
jgi:hypothetical protein